MTLWTVPRLVLLGAVYRRIVCRTEREFAFVRREVNMFLQNIYDISLEVHCNVCERSNLLLQVVLLKAEFSHDFLFVALHHVFAITCMFQDTHDDVDVRIV